MHICLRCRNKLDEIPDEVLAMRIEESLTELPDGYQVKRIEREINIAPNLKAQMKEMKAIYKYVHFCPKLIAIVVGSDSPAQQRKDCAYFME